MGHAVAQLFEALGYKPEGRGFDSLWYHQHNPSGRNMSLVDTDSNRNEYQEYFLGGKGGRCVSLTNLPPSCLEIWEPQPSTTFRACPGLYRDCFTFILQYK